MDPKQFADKTAKLMSSFCQSCGMPLTEETDFGDEADGSKSKEYCSKCYKGGKFTAADVTIEQMADMTAPIVAQNSGMTVEESKVQCLEMFPLLKRWKK